MYLKSLEIQGFKSFPDRTVLTFDNDITAIVGPNGSGKSNISDAIRWVMGEQSTRALRGAKMEDVIFGGTQKRSQVGFAEASLIMDNSDGAFRIDASEIMVTRRYYRSGESEYYINKRAARLRDVNELFMDTGLGREGYSNISQGRIDEILSVKSTDRREIFEEAAGISKYRHRKEETERRLAATQDNLLRIGDKISELELQVEPLREQAARAQKYLEFRGELKGLELAVWLDALERLAAAAKKAEEDYRSAAFILQQEHDALNGLYSTAESLSFSLHERDLKTEALRDEIAAMETEGQRTEGQLAVLQSNRDNRCANMERISQELSEQENRTTGIAEQIAARLLRVQQIEQQALALQQRLDETLLESGRLAESAEGMTRRFLELREEQAKAQAGLAAADTELQSLAASLSQLEARRQELASDREQAAAREQQTQQTLHSCQKRLSEARENVQASQNRISGFQLRLQARAQKRDALSKTLHELTVSRDTTHSRLAMFAEMEREYEGYSKAVKRVMQEASRGALRGIHGPVSKLIQTDDRYTVAIEIALGAAMQHIVCSSENDAKAAISYLKRSDSGRATFLPMDVLHGKRLQEKGIEQCRGFVGVASALVRCEAQYQDILENLLGKTVIAEQLDAAIAIAGRYGHRFRIVTLDGQVLNAGGSMTGGSVSRSSGILSRANEVKRLQLQMKELEKSLSETKTALTEAERAAAQVEFELTTARGELRSAEDAVLRLEGEEKQYALLAQTIADALSSADAEQQAICRRVDSELARRETLQSSRTALESSLRQLNDALQEVSDGQNAATERSAALHEQITSRRMELAALDAERATASDAVEQLRQLERDMQGDRTQKQTLIASIEAEVAQIDEQMENTRQLLLEHGEKTEEKRAALKAAIAERMEVEAKKTATEREAQNKNKDILNLERESARLESRKNAAELEEKQIVDKLWDSYELTPGTAPAEKAEIDSVQQANRRIAELKRKISALGTPNLGAIDEFARVNERYSYLCAQRDDVTLSKQELEAIIRDITTQMTEIFTTEFAKINTYFSQTFVEMFGGGKASLELEDAANPLTCGIEIRVQPPGKQLKTITLLSGGEKAFVAIALYFAILKVRPTPFCMLDEIDAALDDRNVERFASYLRNLCDKTQFIVITHRRGTMEEADILYGVTMQEQGVSKILHLNLNELEQQLGIVE